MATKKAFQFANLPNELYVYREKDGDSSYLMQWENLTEAAESAEKGSVIGTYTLKSWGTYKVEKTVTEV
jgi:hypothetical protein